MTAPPTYPMGYARPPKPPGMAIASLATGIAGLFFALCLAFLPILPILAVVFGHISLATINHQGLPGRGLALTGLITGYIGLAISVVILILLVIGIITPPTPNF